MEFSPQHLTFYENMAMCIFFFIVRRGEGVKEKVKEGLKLQSK